MLKKLVVLGIVGFIAVSAIKGSRVGSFLRSEYGSIKDRVEKSIPPEREIARLRSEVKQLDKDMYTIVDRLAKERVEVRNLRDKADSLRAQQSRDKELLTARAAAIKAATEQVTFGDRKLSISEAKTELDEGVQRFTANQNSLDVMISAISTRDKVKSGLERQLEAMSSQKSELTAAVNALEAELTALKLHQMESKYQTDDSRLARIKEDIRELRTKMAIEREKLALMPAVFDSAPTKPALSKSVDDIMAPLSQQPVPVAD